MDDAWLLHRRNRAAMDEPVRGNRQHGARSGQRLPEFTPCCGKAVVLQRVHGAAVPDEGGRHFGGIAQCLPLLASRWKSSACHHKMASIRAITRGGGAAPAGRPGGRGGGGGGGPRV